MISLRELAAAAERVDSFSPAELPEIIDQMEAELLVMQFDNRLDYYSKGAKP